MQNDRASCLTCEQALVIDKKNIQYYGIIAIACAFFIFIAGYYLGKKNATDGFKEELEQQAFADHIQHSLHVLYNTPQSCDESTEQEPQSAELQPDTTSANGTEQEPLQQPTVIDNTSYYAQLITYHSPVLAQKFIDRLQKKGIKAVMIKQSAKASNGKTIRRYQVVTAPYNSKQELDRVLQMIKSTEKIAHIHSEPYKALKGNS